MILNLRSGIVDFPPKADAPVAQKLEMKGKIEQEEEIIKQE